MSITNTTIKKRLSAIILCFMMVMLMSLSAFYIADEAGHKCNDDNCPVCAVIHQCENVLHNITDSSFLTLSVLIPIIFFLVNSLLLEVNTTQETLVSQKIRLND